MTEPDTRGDAARLSYADILDAESSGDPHRLTVASLRLALQDAQDARVTSFGVLPIPSPGHAPERSRERVRAILDSVTSRGLGVVRLVARPQAARPHPVCLVPGIDPTTLVTLRGGAPSLYCGPETDGNLVLNQHDGTQIGDAAPSVGGIVRLYSLVANAPTAFVYPPQGFAQRMMRAAWEERKPGPPFDALSTVITGDEPARALALVLEAIQPQRTRQFIHRLVPPTASWATLYNASDVSPVSIHLGEPTASERRTRARRLLVAVRFTGEVETEFDILDEAMRDRIRDGAPDLCLVDDVNGLVVMVECQKAQFQTPTRLRHRLSAVGKTSTGPEPEIVEVAWNEVGATLADIVRADGDAVEIDAVRQFLHYIHATGLAELQRNMDVSPRGTRPDVL